MNGIWIVPSILGPMAIAAGAALASAWKWPEMIRSARFYAVFFTVELMLYAAIGVLAF